MACCLLLLAVFASWDKEKGPVNFLQPHTTIHPKSEILAYNPRPNWLWDAVLSHCVSVGQRDINSIDRGRGPGNWGTKDLGEIFRIGKQS